MIECSIGSAEGFRIINLRHDKREDSKVTVIVRTVSGEDYVFLPDMSPESINAEYPEKSVNMLSKIEKREYKLYFDCSMCGNIASIRVLIDEDDIVSEKCIDV